jgi:hypothetical protein
MTERLGDTTVICDFRIWTEETFSRSHEEVDGFGEEGGEVEREEERVIMTERSRVRVRC